ncbi:MAG: hypothetical protein N2747_10260 [Chitinophagaceae bacterium]|nr:hypothetical protein [Chitinophagaceae bacterium]
MKLFRFFIFIPLCNWLHAQPILQPIGYWREHLPYHNAMDLAVSDNGVVCATRYSLFVLSVGRDNMERFSKINGLSETGVAAMAFQNGRLLIAYDNSNIDLLTQNNIFNISDLKRRNLPGDKTVYHVFPYQNDFYLSAGFGIVVINGLRREIKDTWIIGTAGTQKKVYGMAVSTSHFWAATEEGLKRTSIQNPNPADFSTWQSISGTAGLPAGACQHVFGFQNKLYVQKNDSLFFSDGGPWSFFYASAGKIISSSSSQNKIIICEKLGFSSRIIMLNPDGSLFSQLSGSPIRYPKKAVLHQQEVWIADSLSGLLCFNRNRVFERYVPNSPASAITADIAIFNKKVYAVAGAVTPAGQLQQIRDGISILSDNQWKIQNAANLPPLDSIPDLSSVVLSKNDESLWIGSYGGGLIHLLKDNRIQVYKQGFLGANMNQPNQFSVTGLAFDQNHDLWIANSGAAFPLVVKTSAGVWKNLAVPFPLSQNALGRITVDRQNLKWIVLPHGNGLACYDSGPSPENTADDRWKKFSSGTGSGNLPSSRVNCVVADKNNFIWVGTSDGVAVFRCANQIFSATHCEADRPIVSSGTFAGYLLQGHDVRSIAVDGADRKWFATSKGVFLTNTDGDNILMYFTEENSPLLSNDVHGVTIDGYSGEVFFATAKGLCSYRSTATEAELNENHIIVFPNPVPPDFAGQIAIRNVPENAVVKITETDGRLVFQTRALGGQAVWNGRNYKGEKVVSGAYLIFIQNTAGKETLAAKLFFISKR